MAKVDSEKIIKLTKDVIEKYSEIDDFIDKSLEPIKDITDTLNDLFTPIKTLNAIVNIKRKYTIKSFLKNYAQCLNNENFEVTQKEQERLTAFFRNEKNILYISDIIEGVTRSKSIKSSSILGVIAGKFLTNKKDLIKEDLIIVEGLKQLDDFDLDNYIYLIEEFLLKDISTHAQKSELWDKVISEVKEFSGLKVEKDQLIFDMTIEKLKAIGILSSGYGGIGSGGGSRGVFIFTPISKKFYSLIKDTRLI